MPRSTSNTPAKPRKSAPAPPLLADDILRAADQRYQAVRTPPRPAPPAPPLASAILATFPKRAGKIAQRKRVAAPKGAAGATLRVYPNLHPGANTNVDREAIFHLREVAGGYRAQQGHSSRWMVPNLKYNFVRTLDGDLLMHNRFRHPPLAGGKPVLYAGEAEFSNGKLSWWSNASGHYRPDDGDALQAGLPLENFYAYDQVLRGAHKRKSPPKIQAEPE